MASGGARPGSGRKRKDPALKALTGTARADREVALPDAVAIAPMIAPFHLGDLEQLLFGNIAGILAAQNRASPHFSEHVALLAIRLAQIQRLKAVLEIEGDTCTSKTVRKVGGEQIVTTMIRARPEAAMLADAMRQAQSLLGELMLNPSAALRMAEGHKTAPAGAFDDF